jgi:hypothetical protein
VVEAYTLHNKRLYRRQNVKYWCPPLETYPFFILTPIAVSSLILIFRLWDFSPRHHLLHLKDLAL